MKIYSYGEDALTLWALKNNLNDLIDNGEKVQKIFYRPSFGRKGGERSSEFGEFDFIIISNEKVYLGESKWHNSSEIKNGIITLKANQLKRHQVMEQYIKALSSYKNTNNTFENWGQFKQHVEDGKYVENVPGEKSILASNLKTVLNVIFNECGKKDFNVKNLLVVFNKDSDGIKYSQQVEEDAQYADIKFDIKVIKYNTALEENFIEVG